MSLRPLDEGREIAAAWSDLAKRSLTANIFYEPQFALPAKLPFGDGVQLLAIHADQSASAPLLGVWPFRLVRLRWGVPLPVLLGWTHPFAASGVPLIDAERADEALTALYHLPSSFPGLPEARLDAAAARPGTLCRRARSGSVAARPARGAHGRSRPRHLHAARQRRHDGAPLVRLALEAAAGIPPAGEGWAGHAAGRRVRAGARAGAGDLSGTGGQGLERAAPARRSPPRRPRPNSCAASSAISASRVAQGSTS